MIVVVVVCTILALKSSRILLVDPKRTLLRATVVPTIVTVGRTCGHGRRKAAACRHGPRINGTTVSIPVGSSMQEGRRCIGRMRVSRSTGSPCRHRSNPRRHGLASTTTAVGRVIPPRGDAVPNRRSRRGRGPGRRLKIHTRPIIGCVVIVVVVTVWRRSRGKSRGRGTRGGKVKVRDLRSSGHNSGGGNEARDGFVFAVVVVAVVVVVVFAVVVVSDRKACSRGGAKAGG